MCSRGRREAEAREARPQPIQQQKSKQQQAERDEKARQAEQARQASAAAEEARKHAEARRAAADDIKRAAEASAAWERFVSLGEDARIRECDVPWPTLDATSLGLNHRLAKAAERKAAKTRAAPLIQSADELVAQGAMA